MTLFKNKYRIESARLIGWDYANPGAYFVTVVTKDRECIFGEIENGEMILNHAGKIAHQCWINIPHHFPNVVLDAFIIMPNQVHGIIIITERNVMGIVDTGAVIGSDVGTMVETQNYVETQNFASLQQQPYKNQFGPQSKNLASIVRGFKIGVTNWFRENNVNVPIWQPRFHEHIIRNETSWQKIVDYIKSNPATWKEDRFFNK